VRLAGLAFAALVLAAAPLRAQDALEEALGEGILSGHPDMPEFRFDADEVGAIIVYLQSIQQR
jgi:hypothetical protein